MTRTPTTLTKTRRTRSWRQTQRNTTSCKERRHFPQGVFQILTYDFILKFLYIQTKPAVSLSYPAPSPCSVPIPPFPPKVTTMGAECFVQRSALYTARLEI